MKAKISFASACLVLWLATFGNGQEPKVFKYIDQEALKATKEVEESLDSLAGYLVKPCKTDREKARSIYRWITDRIAYDAESFFAQMLGDNSSEAVLKSRKGVCAGYANLYADLARRAGLEVAIVSGYAKGVDFDPEKKLTKPNHAWNAVRIDKEWQLIDATWGAGYLKDKAFVKRFTPFYFQVAPEKLAFTHFPSDDKWRLTARDLDLEQFFQQPKVERGLWELGVSADLVRKTIADKQFRELVHVYSFPSQSTTLVNAPLSKSLRAGMKYSFEFKSDDFLEMAGLQNNKPAPFARKGNVFRGNLAPQKGTMRIIGRTKDEPKRYAGILEYVVE